PRLRGSLPWQQRPSAPRRVRGCPWSAHRKADRLQRPGDPPDRQVRKRRTHAAGSWYEVTSGVAVTARRGTGGPAETKTSGPTARSSRYRLTRLGRVVAILFPRPAGVGRRTGGHAGSP